MNSENGCEGLEERLKRGGQALDSNSLLQTRTASLSCPDEVVTDMPPLGAIAELCIVVPVMNERENIAPLVARLDMSLTGVTYEVIFIDDDSTDGTREAIVEAAKHDRRVRLLHRIGRRGLSSAFVEGAQASLAPYIAAMDGDLQHDEMLLPKMLVALREQGYELAIGSRYLVGAGLGDWEEKRVTMSRRATRLSQMLLRSALSDPMSGFFMLRRDTFERAVRRLSSMGFKCLIDIISSLPEPPHFIELPYKFQRRIAGESKLDAVVVRDFVLLLMDKLFGHVVPARFLLFAGVGAIGILSHMTILWICLPALTKNFMIAQAVATGITIIGNFWLNNIFTFRDRRLHGWSFMRGLFTFAAICSVGAVANLNISAFVFDPTANSGWWLAGLIGAFFSLVWNYAASSVLTWRKN